jgi:DNA-binding winged helix-turn-helix (wHTH) protein/predicted ATPase/type II secretory pathway predicted ATPase ExeA
VTPDRQFAFGPFSFDARTGELRGDSTQARLTPRTAAVLALLVERAERLVTKQELFEQVWGGLAVSDAALISCIQELRHALGDDARRPRYIETQHRRGYRLIVPAASVPQAGNPPLLSRPERSELRKLVGRTTEMGQLGRHCQVAASGQRQVVFVTGEPGIGKSALVSTFSETLDSHTARIALGQCLDQHGVGEPYLPLIEALTRLATSTDGRPIRAIIATHAPSWLALMPSLWTLTQRSAPESHSRATRERMLRELTSAIEAIATEQLLVLLLEDIHWSDASTLDWLKHVASRPERARLFVLATFRPADVGAIATGLGGIVTELLLHGRCQEIALNPLNLEAVETYLATRLTGSDQFVQRQETARLLLERTGGNPLFMVSIVNQLAAQAATATPGAITAIPTDVRRFIDRQIDDLDEADRELLTAASVIRRQFATAAVAAAMEGDSEMAEVACARLARKGVFIIRSGSERWPDGTPVELYTFRHDLYRELLYERLPATQRELCHARVGRRLERAWNDRLDAIVAELAEHFERANELARAIPYHQRAAAKALRRSANQEAIVHLQRALHAIGHVAEKGERAKIEVELRVGMGAAFMAMRGFGAPEVLEAYAKAQALCDQLGERPDLFPSLWGQWMFRAGRGETQVTRRLCTRLLSLADKFDDSTLKIQAHHATWSTAFVCGEFARARGHAEDGLRLFDPAIHHFTASSYGNHDAGCCARNFSAMSLALTGDSDGARAMIEGALEAANKLNDPFSLALTLYFTSAAAQMLGDVALATINSERSLQIAQEHDLAQPLAWSMAVAGWCAAENGDRDRGIDLTTHAVARMQTIQSRHFLCYLLGLLADAHLKAGHDAQALKVAEEGLAVAAATGELFYSAELHRLRGELLARPSHALHREARDSFRTAITFAKKQGARILERKVSESLIRWCE